MIKQIYTSGKYMVSSGAPGSTYVGQTPGAIGAGNMRFNTSSQQIEVYDGNNWVLVASSTPTISLTYEAEQLLDWAKRKKAEEDAEIALAESNPTISDLIEQRKKIEEQINIVKTLIKPEPKS